MKVVDINGVYETSDIHGLETVLMKRCAGSSNSFWLSHDGQEYPTLSLLVKDDLATLNYVPREFNAGFSSIGGMPELEPGGTTTFCISKNRADDVVVLNDAVMPFSAAFRAAKEFFSSKNLPTTVKWLQL